MLSAEQVSSIERLLRAGWNGRQIARQLGHSRGTVRAVVHGRHCLVRGRQRAVEEMGGSESHHKGLGPLRRCPAGHTFYGPACRTCRIRTRRSRLFHAIESAEPLESRLEPLESRRLLDTLQIASGKIRRDTPRPRVYKSPAFRFHFGFIGHVFCLRLHPPIRIFPEVAR